ncbi:MAG: stage III sporulation protein AE [Lachnospiraceae bacterium]|nr:stage III sporulation protein AE [Lachnospiraceae bacterium]
MRFTAIVFILFFSALILLMPASADEITDSMIENVNPEEGLQEDVLDQIGTFSVNHSNSLGKMLSRLLEHAWKDWNLLGLRDCLRSVGIILASAVFCMMLSQDDGGGKILGSAACLAVVGCCITNLHSMIGLGIDTVNKIHAYVKPLLPGLASMIVASGSVSRGHALYGLSAWFLETMIAVISGILVPIIYLHAAMSAAESLLQQSNLSRLRDFLKWLITTGLRWILFGFTGFLTATGLFSGTSDAQKVKAARYALSGMVPVVGSMVSDTSQSVVSAANIIKNSVGTYGMLAVLAICAAPFLQLWIQYFLLKFTAAICGILGADRVAGLIEHLSQSMGMVVGMIGVCCILVLLILALCIMVVSP